MTSSILAYREIEASLPEDPTLSDLQALSDEHLRGVHGWHPVRSVRLMAHDELLDRRVARGEEWPYDQIRLKERAKRKRREARKRAIERRRRANLPFPVKGGAR